VRDFNKQTHVLSIAA